WENERPMITISWSTLPVPAGIYTGRTAKELKLALKRLQWEDFPDSMIITSDSGVTKPSPRGLEILCQTARASKPLFLGDTESDRQTLHAFGKGTFAAIGGFLSDAKFAFPDPEEALEYFGLFSPRAV
ncbi:MAG TPA: HAD family hydrolase, partial [Synergistaceae bacterium]|nr:HAD family hydrolase [Synergistaceae bacterium]